jgi:hypothetical protein
MEGRGHLVLDPADSYWLRIKTTIDQVQTRERAPRHEAVVWVGWLPWREAVLWVAIRELGLAGSLARKLK